MVVLFGVFFLFPYARTSALCSAVFSKHFYPQGKLHVDPAVPESDVGLMLVCDIRIS